MTRPILTTNDDLATIQIDVSAARALGLTEDGIARLLLDAQAAAEVLARATDARWTVERVEPAEVTGETITDEQVIDLQAQAEAEGDRNLAMTAQRALQEPRTLVWEHCRKLCAAAYNTRSGAKP